MKLSNTVVSALVIVAVLVAAYALGLLIRQARMGGARPARQVADANGAGAMAAPRPAMSPQGPGASQIKDTPEARAQAKENKAKVLKKMDSLTQAETEQYRNQVRKQVGGRRGGKGSQGLTPEERQAYKPKMQGRSKGGRQDQDGDAATSPTEGTNTGKADSGPEGAGEG
jgi:hypothetical protein